VFVQSFIFGFGVALFYYVGGGSTYVVYNVLGSILLS